MNKYLNETAAPETQYSKEEYAAMKKAEREAVWVQVDARMGEVLADAPALQEFLNFMSQSRNSLPNQLLLSGQNADITDARTFQQWKDAGRHIRTGEEGYTAIVGQVYENNGRKASGYNIGKVFDITQTRGRPVPPPAEYQVDELIAASIESSPVPIQISDSLPDGIQAQYVPKNRTIYVRNGMDMAQLKAMYKDDWESLVGLCDEFLYLGGTEKETHKYVSELLGKETISTTSYNQSKGRSGSYSINRQQSGRDLMTPDEVRLLDNSKCILFIRGERPVVDFKYNLLKHPNIRCIEDGGAAPYDYTAADNARDDLPGAPENYELLDMDDFLPAEAAEMKPTIQRIRRPK